MDRTSLTLIKSSVVLQQKQCRSLPTLGSA
jgi:hypothetical protein